MKSKKSSAYKIPYEIRPSKQTERRLLLDILKSGSEAGLVLSGYKYIGFGGFKFYDFEMLFRHVGIRDMTSIEIDKSIIARCKFNKPFNFIIMKEGAVADYLGQAIFRNPLIAWLDYDDRLSNDIIDDVLLISGRAPVGSFIFVTIDARMPPGLRAQSAGQRIIELREELQSFALNPTAEDVEPSNFSTYAERVLWSALKAGLSKRSDGDFVPLLRLFYEDTALMVTVGACLCPRDLAIDLRRRMQRDFGFLLPRGDKRPYTIAPFNFTARERYLLDSVATARKGSAGTRRNLKRIGISKSVIEDYKRLIRFVPKYFESYI